MQRLLCCQEDEVASLVDGEERVELVNGGGSREVVEDVQRQLERELEASKATVIAMDKRRKAELEKAEEKRKLEVQLLEERRRNEREELEGEVVKLRRRLEEVEIPFKEEVPSCKNLSHLLQVISLRGQLSRTEEQRDTSRSQ